MEMLASIWRSRAKDWIVGPLAPANTPDQMQQEPVRAEEEYLTVTLKSLRIANVRRGWAKFYGVMHSRVGLSYVDDTGEAEFNVVTVPSMLKDIDASSLERVIQINRPLGGPVPYRGGSLELELGLFSVQSKDLVGPYIELLQELSEKAGVAYVAQTIPYVSLIKKGIEMLTGLDKDIHLHVGIDRGDNPPTTGWFAVIADDKSTSALRLADLKVDPNDMRLLDSTGQPLQDIPYFVYTVVSSTERDDWHRVPELRVIYNRLREDIRRNNISAAKHTMEALKRYLHTSPDLLLSDAERISLLVEQRVEASVAKVVTTAGRKGPDIGDLTSLPLYK